MKIPLHEAQGFTPTKAWRPLWEIVERVLPMLLFMCACLFPLLAPIDAAQISHLSSLSSAHTRFKVPASLAPLPSPGAHLPYAIALQKNFTHTPGRQLSGTRITHTPGKLLFSVSNPSLRRLQAFKGALSSEIIGKPKLSRSIRHEDSVKHTLLPRNTTSLTHKCRENLGFPSFTSLMLRQGLDSSSSATFSHHLKKRRLPQASLLLFCHSSPFSPFICVKKSLVLPTVATGGYTVVRRQTHIFQRRVRNPPIISYPNLLLRSFHSALSAFNIDDVPLPQTPFTDPDLFRVDVDGSPTEFILPPEEAAALNQDEEQETPSSYLGFSYSSSPPSPASPPSSPSSLSSPPSSLPHPPSSPPTTSTIPHIFPPPTPKDTPPFADDNPYFTPHNIRNYHQYNPYYEPIKFSDGRPHWDPEAAKIPPFGWSPPRPLRERDLAYPSVPMGWRTFSALALDKTGVEWLELVRNALVMRHLVWGRLSTRLVDSTAKMLVEYNIKNPTSLETCGNYFIFTAPTLHHASSFMKSNPYMKAGLYRDLIIYELEDATNEHFLLGRANENDMDQFLVLGGWGDGGEGEVCLDDDRMGRRVEGSFGEGGESGGEPLGGGGAASASSSAASFSSFGDTNTNKVMLKGTASTSAIEAAKAFEEDADLSESSPASEKPPVMLVHAASRRRTSSSAYRKVSANPLQRATTEEGKISRLALRELLEEKHLRFLCRTSCVHKRSLLRAPRKDTHLDLQRPVQQFLPILDHQIDTVKESLRYYEVPGSSTSEVRPEEEGESIEHHAPYSTQNSSQLGNKAADSPHGNTQKQQKPSIPPFSSTSSGIHPSLTSLPQPGIHPPSMIHSSPTSPTSTPPSPPTSDPPPPSPIIAEANIINSSSLQSAIEWANRDPFTRSHLFTSLFVAPLHEVDFYGKSGTLQIPSAGTMPLDADVDDFYTTQRDQPENLITSVMNITEDLSRTGDQIYYKEYLKDWAWIALPEGEYFSDIFSVSGDRETGDDHNDIGSYTAFAANKDPENFREFRPGFWLYKPESKILYQDPHTGGLMFGTGIDGTFSWNKPVEENLLAQALIDMEITKEETRKGRDAVLQTHFAPVTANPDFKSHLSPEEEERMKWGLPHWDVNPGALGEKDDTPSGMDFINSARLESGSANFQRLMRWPSLIHDIQSDFLDRVDRGEATLLDDPFRNSEEEMELDEEKLCMEFDDKPVMSVWEE